MLVRSFALAALFAVTSVACSAEVPPDFRSEPRDRGGEQQGEDGLSDGTPQTVVAAPEPAACAVASAEAQPVPLHLVVVLDKSGSMCEYTSKTSPRDCNNPNSKWQQVTQGLKTFFASPASAGISVSLIAFPASKSTCDASSYSTPIAADVVLPDTAGALGSAIGALNADGSTPTRPALEGAINYGRTIEARLAGKGKVAVVMATDGYPQDCSNNSISSASSVASAAKGTIPTYVIGVGSLLSDLNALASAGGTGQAFIVNATGTAVGGNLTAALVAIRGASLACEYTLPAAPEGQTLDIGAVNVKHTSSAAATSTVPYSEGCASGEGWRYDDVNAPTKIQLCDAVCNRVKNDEGGRVDLELGCKTEGGAVR